MRKFFTLLTAAIFAGSIFAADAQKLSAVVDLSQGVFTPKAGETPAYITWSVAGGKITITQLQGKNKQSAVSDQNIAAPRIYKGHILEFEAKDGYVIDTVSIRTGVGGKNYASDNVVAGVAINDKDTTVISSEDFIVKCEKVNKAQDTIINKNGAALFYIQADCQVRADSIYIAYTKPASSTPEILAGDLTFGTFVPEVSESQKLNVAGENLSAPISASFAEGTAFEVAGSLTAAGGELTISVKATADGDYTDQLTLTSGSATKKVTVSAHVVATSGKGSKEVPFTVPDVKKLNNTFSGKYWIEGFILGGISTKRDIIDTVNTAIGLAVSMDKPADTVAVQLPNNKVRKALNAKDNKSAGWEVKVYGDLESYLNGGLGLRNTSDYEIISGGVPSSEAAITSLKVGEAVLEASENKFSYAAPNDAANELPVVFTVSKGATANPASGFMIAVPAAGAEAVDSTIVVTAEDGTTKATYHVLVTRKAADAPKSDVATIKSLTINGEAVTEKEGVFAVELPADSKLAEVEVAFILTDPNAKADKANPFKITVPAAGAAAATEKITVTAEDGTTKKEYTVSVSKAKADDQAVDNINAANQAVKFIENGQLVIIKNGVRYNVQGQSVR